MHSRPRLVTNKVLMRLVGTFCKSCLPNFIENMEMVFVIKLPVVICWLMIHNLKIGSCRPSYSLA